MKAKYILLAALIASAVNVTESELIKAYVAFVEDFNKEGRL